MTEQIEQAISKAIEYAEKRLDEEAKRNDEYAMSYWSAYLDGARAVKWQIKKIEENVK